MFSESSSQESPSSSSTLGMSEYFKDSRHFSIGGHGNFSTVHGDQHNAYYLNTVTEALLKKKNLIVGTEEEEAEYEQFPEIKRGEFMATQDISQNDSWLYDREQCRRVKQGERTVVAGDVRIGGVASRCTVVQYTGQEAAKLWKKDFGEFGGVRRSENAQLVAINLSKVPMLVLTGDLVPLAHLVDQVGELGQRYLKTLALQMDCWWDNSLWIDTSRGVFCRGPQGPRCDIDGGFGIEDLPLDAELVKEDNLFRYLGSRNQDREVVYRLSSAWPNGRTISEIEVNRPMVIWTLTDTILAVGSGVWYEDKEKCLGEREELPNGVTRFTLKPDTDRSRLLCLDFDWREAWQDWFAQAPSIFHAHGIPLGDDTSTYKLVLPKALEGTLSDSETKERRREECPPIYLFVPPLSTSTFWSFDPDGQHPITTYLCHYLGLPTSLSSKCWEYSWKAGTYERLRAYQIARGFDPNTTEFARHNRYRIYDSVIIEQLLSSRFEEIEDLEESEEWEESEDSDESEHSDESGDWEESEESVSVEPTETLIRPVHREEAPDMLLSGEVQPEDLTASTTTQGHALQKSARYSSNYPHPSPTATFSASTGLVGVDTTEIDCTLPRDHTSVSPSAETSPRTHLKDLRIVPAETEAIIPKPPTDIILSVSSLDIQSILRQKKTTYEFVSKRSMSPLPSVNRIWFHVNAPEFSLISYICEVGTMTPTDGKMKGKKQTSDYAVSFSITSCYRLHQPLALCTLEQQFGLKSVPREGMMVPVPTSLLEAVPWQTQHLIWPLQTQSSDPAAKSAVAQKQVKKKTEVKRVAWR